MRTPMTKTTREVFAEWRAERRQRQERENAELERLDRAAAERLANIRPLPLFSEATTDGKCPKCQGQQFRDPSTAAGIGGFIVGGLIGAAYASASEGGIVECLTCGEQFQRG